MDTAPLGRSSRGAAAARSARRWAVGGLLATAHLTLDLVWGWVGAVVLLTLLVVGVALLPALGLGLLVLAAFPLAASWWAAAERARVAAVLGVVITAPPRQPAGGLTARLRALLSDRTTWGAVAWALVLPVLGTVEAAVVLCLWSAAVALITEPAWAAAGAGSGWLRTAAWLLAPVAGLLLVPVALAVARGFAAVDVAVVRALLGADPVPPLRQRVEELRATRAGVVDAADAERRRRPPRTSCRTRASSTSGCPPRTPTRASAQRSWCAPPGPAWPSCCSPSTSRSATPATCWRAAAPERAVWGTC